MSDGSVFPLILDTFTNKVDGVSPVLAVETNTQSSAIEKLEAKVGADNSLVSSSLDYKVTQLRADMTVVENNTKIPDWSPFTPYLKDKIVINPNSGVYSEGKLIRAMLRIVNNYTSSSTITADVSAGNLVLLNEIEELSLSGLLTVNNNLKLNSKIYPVSDSTSAIQITKSDALTPVLTINTTASGAVTVDGTLVINGNIIQNGSAYETHAEKLYTTKDLIITRDGAISGLAVGAYTGIQATKYDGVNNGQLVFDRYGWARVGDVGALQKLSTIEESPVHNGMTYWDVNNLQLKTSSSLTTDASGNIISNTIQLTSGIKDNNIVTPIAIGDVNNVSLGTINKTIIGSINEMNIGKIPFHGIESRPVGALNPLPTIITTPTLTLGTTTHPITYYYRGEKVVVSSDITTTLNPGSSGLYFIYFNGNTGTIYNSTSFLGVGLTSDVYVATIHWNGINYGVINDERHGYSRNTAWHTWAHKTIGTRYVSGLTLTHNGGTGAGATLNLTAGEINDEDIQFTISNSSSFPTANTCRLWWQANANYYMFDPALSTTPFKKGANNRPVYVRDTDYAVVQMTSALNRYINVFVYATTDLHTPLYMFTETLPPAIVATNGYTSLANARAVPFPNLSAYGLSAELKPIYRLIIRADGLVTPIDTTLDDYRTVSSLPMAAGNTSTTASAVAFNPAGTLVATTVQTAIEELDGKKLATVAVSYGISGNGTISIPLTNNLITGLSGGQIVAGGNASGETLTLTSTASGVKGKILIGVSGYDEVNNRLGLGLNSPNQQLEITQNFRLPSTVNAGQYGVIYKDTIPFIHDFNYGNNGSIVTDGQNTFIGLNSGNLTMGLTANQIYQSSYNTGVGNKTLTSLTTGYYNTAIGYSALYLNTIGFNNTAVGYNAGRFITGGAIDNATSNTSLYLGSETKAKIDGGVNEIAVGYNTVGNGSNTATWGNSSITNHYFTGIINTTDFMTTPSSAPTNDYQVANKKYVDTHSSSGGGGSGGPRWSFALGGM